MGLKRFHDQNLISSYNIIAKHCLVNCIDVGGGLEEGYQLPSNALSTDYPIEAGGRNGPPGLGLMPRYNGGISDVKIFNVYCHFEVLTHFCEPERNCVQQLKISECHQDESDKNLVLDLFSPHALSILG